MFWQVRQDGALSLALSLSLLSLSLLYCHRFSSVSWFSPLSHKNSLSRLSKTLIIPRQRNLREAPRVQSEAGR